MKSRVEPDEIGNSEASPLRRLLYTFGKERMKLLLGILLISSTIITWTSAYATDEENTNSPEIMGQLGFPIHTYLEIKGFALQDTKTGGPLLHFAVFEVNGKELEKAVVISDFDGINLPLKDGVYTLGAFETARFIGIPENVLENSPSWREKLSETVTEYDPYLEKEVTRAVHRRPNFRFHTYLYVTDILNHEPNQAR